MRPRNLQQLFVRAGCELPLFKSETKFESRTGWPSFLSLIEGTVGTKLDRSFLMERTDVHCRRCGNHCGRLKICETQVSRVLHSIT